MAPPGCPDFAPVTILNMSLLTWDEILFSSSILVIVKNQLDIVHNCLHPGKSTKKIII